MFPKNVRFQRSFECKKKKKKKEGTTRNVNIKMDFKHRVPFRRGKKLVRGKIVDKSEYIQFILNERGGREKGSFAILVLLYTYNSIRKHAS